MIESICVAVDLDDNIAHVIDLEIVAPGATAHEIGAWPTDQDVVPERADQRVVAGVPFKAVAADGRQHIAAPIANDQVELLVTGCVNVRSSRQTNVFDGRRKP